VVQPETVTPDTPPAVVPASLPDTAPLAAAPSGALADTGFNAQGLAKVGLGLVAAGAAGLAVARQTSDPDRAEGD
jgi:hypothetical protein